jgi:hypothetical protein
MKEKSMNETPRPTDDEPFEKPRISMTVLGIILVCGAISTLLWFGMPKLSAVPSLFATSTPAVITTFTPIATPTANPTRTPLPTSTTTPVPSWVTEFAEPILTSIKDREPDFADDFSRHQSGWQFQNQDNPGKMEIVDGVMRVSANKDLMEFAEYEMFHFNDFVLQIDANLRQVQSIDAVEISWRSNQYTGADVSFKLWHDGSWLLSFCDKDCKTVTSVLAPIGITSSATITIISKGAEFAIYINSIPLTYVNDIRQLSGTNINLRLGVSNISQTTSMVEYDSLKVWDLSNTKNLP